MIPLFITNLIDGLPVPLYGDGQNVRDWLHVDDHCRAVDLLLDEGQPGEVYNIGGGNEVRNVDLTHRLLELVGRPESLIRRVQDRPGHDRRYSLDTAKLRAWAGRRRTTSRGPGRDRRVVSRERVVVAADQGTGRRPSSAYMTSAVRRGEDARGPDRPVGTDAGCPTLVTGAAGFAGVHLLDRLARSDDRRHRVEPSRRPHTRADATGRHCRGTR